MAASGVLGRPSPCDVPQGYASVDVLVRPCWIAFLISLRLPPLGLKAVRRRISTVY